MDYFPIIITILLLFLSIFSFIKHVNLINSKKNNNFQEEISSYSLMRWLIIKTI
ncbi:hypothetical protein Q5A_005655 [Serratia inhibens PRI-2C]|nr:hypothetical protein Q5A_005655 [Serratia inhibens PRI-2C]